jgi:hypothetical protein
MANGVHVLAVHISDDFAVVALPCTYVPNWKEIKYYEPGILKHASYIYFPDTKRLKYAT